jgi:hypothetical protein
MEKNLNASKVMNDERSRTKVDLHSISVVCATFCSVSDTPELPLKKMATHINAKTSGRKYLCLSAHVG